jgi:outer membrane protein
MEKRTRSVASSGAVGRAAAVLGQICRPRFIAVAVAAGCLWTGNPSALSAATLEQCIQTALEKNPGAAAAALRIEAAQAMLDQAHSSYYPQLFVAGNYGYTDNPTQAFMMQLNQRNLNMQDPAFDPNNPDNTDNFRFSLGLRYRLYDRGKRKIQTSMAALSKEAAAGQLAAVQNELLHQVIRGYYSVLQAQDLVGVQSETITSLEENLRVAGERYRAGSVVKTDVLNLEVRLAQAREDLIRVQNGVQLAIAGLNTAIGEDLIEPTGISAPAPSADLPPLPLPDAAGIENRPELQNARRQTLIKEQEYKDALSDYYPTVSAFGSYDLDSGTLSEFENSYTVGVMAEWEFFSGFRTDSGVRRANREWQAARKDETRLRDQLRLDLQRARIQAQEARQRLEVARVSVDSARESLRITQVRYREGAANITELLTAQVGLTASRSRVVAAYYEYRIALSNVKRAQGSLVSEYAAVAK